MKIAISIMILGFSTLFGLCYYSSKVYDEPYPVENLSRGKASKTEYCGHRYIIWQQNMTDCIVHDPDCACRDKDILNIIRLLRYEKEDNVKPDLQGDL